MSKMDCKPECKKYPPGGFVSHNQKFKIGITISFRLIGNFFPHDIALIKSRIYTALSQQYVPVEKIKFSVCIYCAVFTITTHGIHPDALQKIIEDEFGDQVYDPTREE